MSFKSLELLAVLVMLLSVPGPALAQGGAKEGKQMRVFRILPPMSFSPTIFWKLWFGGSPRSLDQFWFDPMGGFLFRWSRTFRPQS